MERVGERGNWRMRRVGARERDTDGAWQCVERVLTRLKLQVARGGACDLVSGRSWLGFAQD